MRHFYFFGDRRHFSYRLFRHWHNTLRQYERTWGIDYFATVIAQNGGWFGAPKSGTSVSAAGVNAHRCWEHLALSACNVTNAVANGALVILANSNSAFQKRW